MENQLTIWGYIKEVYKQKENIKILHYNAENSSMKKKLAKSGYLNYLGISKERPKGEVNSGLYCIKESSVAYKNNADVLILNEASFAELRNAFNSQAELIIYKPDNLMNHFSFLVIMAYKYARRKKWDFHFKTFTNDKGQKNMNIVFSRKFHKAKEARHYLSPEANLEGFFNLLNEKKLEYVILRWFDKIPFKDINEDIDLLVSDKDIEKVQKLLNEKVGILPFDLYSASGFPGSDFKNMAYYPPYLAENILKAPDVWKGKYLIPNKRNYFLSLLYHAVYHKGEKSGIPVNSGDEADAGAAEHEYVEILQELAKENDIELNELNLKYFHELLEKEGWAPATDTIRKLSQTSGTWLESTIKPNKNNFDKNGELMVFVIREWAAERGLSAYIIDWFEKRGLNIVKAVELDPEQKRKAGQNLRGGNWGKGPWPVSGGNPATLLVFYDYHPVPLEDKYKKRYPHVSNKLYLLKEELRQELNSTLPMDEKTNPIHSADDEIEAIDYITAVSPGILEEIKETIIQWDKDYHTEETVLKDISENKRRAKVELIQHKGGTAVKKTYKAGRERFLNREKYVYGELSQDCVFIPKLLDSGKNYIITPYLETIKFSDNERIKKQLLKRYKKEIFSISEYFYNKGYALIDFHPGNILITKEGLKVIDFEFLYQYEERPQSLDDSFDLMGFPDNFMEDLPFGIRAKDRRKVWRRILY